MHLFSNRSPKQQCPPTTVSCAHHKQDSANCFKYPHHAALSSPPLFVVFPEGYKVIYIPEPIRHASGHCWRHAKCTVDFDEVVNEIV